MTDERVVSKVVITIDMAPELRGPREVSLGVVKKNLQLALNQEVKGC